MPSRGGGPRRSRRRCWRGWARRCPACGEGALMDGYLTVRDACPACGTELHHHRADDGPAWATILITGHLMAPLMLMVFVAFRPTGWVMAIGFSAVFVALSLYLLPRLKGVFVGAAVGEADARLRRGRPTLPPAPESPARRSATRRPSSWCAGRAGRRRC